LNSASIDTRGPVVGRVVMSMRKRRFVPTPLAVLLAALVAPACGNDSLMTPSPVFDAAPVRGMPSPPPTLVVQLSGRVVDADGYAVPAATVTARPLNPAAILSTITDSGGNYNFTFEHAPGFFNVAPIYVEKVGYESVSRFVAGASTDVQVVRVHPITSVAAGEILTLIVTSEDAFCGFDDEWLCRTVWVTTPTDGTLTAEVTGLNPATHPAVDLNRAFALPYSATRSIPVKAGARVRVDVLGLSWQSSARETFTVHTTLTAD
jgi:hypothetical protein